MSWTHKWDLAQGDEKRCYIVHYLDDSPERQEAIEFFRGTGALYPSCPITDYLWTLPLNVANERLAAAPIRLTFEFLAIRGWAHVQVLDDDLRRLSHLSELQELHISLQHITDAGVLHLAALQRLEHLVLYSPRVTNASLSLIGEMSELRTLDLQGCPRITSEAFLGLLPRLPKLVNVYGPHHEG